MHSKRCPGIAFVKVADAPATRADAYIQLHQQRSVRVVHHGPESAADNYHALSSVLEGIDGIGAPDYGDDGMLQYLRTERVIPPYQTRGYKLIELVRVYRAEMQAR